MASQAEIARYQDLRRQGYSGPQAAEMVWGPGGLARMNEEARKRASGNARNNALGQLGGTVAGAVGTRYAYNELFPSKEAVALAAKKATEKAAEEAAKITTRGLSGGMTSAVPTTSPVTSTIPYSNTPSGVSGGMSVAPNSSVSQNFTPVDPSRMPSGSVAPPGTTAVQSNADGTVKFVPTEALNDPGFMASVDWGKVGQGATGAYMLYNAYEQWKKGDKGGAAMSGVTGGTNLAASLGSQSAASAVPYLAAANELYGGVKTQFDKNATQEQKNYALAQLPSRAVGAYFTAGMSTVAEALARKQWGGTMAKADNFLMNNPASLLISPTFLTMKVLKAFGSKKSQAQLERDQVRKALGNAGVLDKQGIGTLADNSAYDFGKDGSTMKWKEIDKIADANPNSWGTTVNLTDALVAGYGPRVNSNLSAWYAKAAVSNAGDDAEKARANVQHFAQQQGLSFDLIKQNLDQGLNDGRMNQQQYDAYLNGANRLFAGMPSTISAPGAPGAPAAAPVREVRPDKGTVRRLSPGMYRTDTGGIQTAPTMRQALEKAYRKGDGTKSEGKKG